MVHSEWLIPVYCTLPGTPRTSIKHAGARHLWTTARTSMYAGARDAWRDDHERTTPHAVSHIRHQLLTSALVSEPKLKHSHPDSPPKPAAADTRPALAHIRTPSTFITPTLPPPSLHGKPSFPPLPRLLLIATAAALTA